MNSDKGEIQIPMAMLDECITSLKEIDAAKKAKIRLSPEAKARHLDLARRLRELIRRPKIDQK